MKKDFLRGMASGAGKALGAAIVVAFLSFLPPVREKLLPWVVAFAKEGSGLIAILCAIAFVAACVVAIHFYRKHRALLDRVRTNKLTIGDMASMEDMRKALEEFEGKLERKKG